jgi:hypothetical protein
MIYEVFLISTLLELSYVSACYYFIKFAYRERLMSRCKCECILQIILFSYPIGADTLGVVHVMFSPFINLAVYKPS